tara:strand:+ start:4372 stop:4536 length:165 start_codon:yes stop_codon:yes gene_type:complete
MPFAGYLAANGDLTFVAVIVAGTIGSVVYPTRQETHQHLLALKTVRDAMRKGAK